MLNHLPHHSSNDIVSKFSIRQDTPFRRILSEHRPNLINLYQNLFISK
ncbi:hypothetical protein XBJ2_2050009 [Xenorhabdus bovienii str. Jollieti]|uniref:Uncharacterized protein n=1 Tax=Xenorhabdus bovienii (strain SS-2004) TaxID=406818 RepID=D3V659_XENBS|nr:hypothetical protein XBJ1_4026 [Xenorhabdus bovienii SS-2004]CDH28861.1 hypothetical protein XBJ2_2050009 [Xenorhabdus bovienii str. Jollieti]